MNLCMIPGCGRVATASGLCKGHDWHFAHGQDPYGHVVRDRATRYCTVPNCGKKHDAMGYCNKHYKRWRLGHPLIKVHEGLTPFDLRIKEMIMALKVPRTTAQLVDLLCVHLETVRRMLRLLHEQGRVYIVDYAPSTRKRGPRPPLYKAGKGEDKARPPQPYIARIKSYQKTYQEQYRRKQREIKNEARTLARSNDNPDNGEH